jgi:hypothetical protein
MKKLKAKSVDISIPQTDPAEDGSEVGVINRERIIVFEEFFRTQYPKEKP